MPSPSPVEGIGQALSDMIPPHLRNDPEVVSGIMTTRGPEVMKNFIANVAQNRTMPIATEAIHRGFNDIAAEQIAQVANNHPEFINRLFSAGSTPAGLEEMIGSAGQLRGGNNPLRALVAALLSDDTNQIQSFAGLVRQRLDAASIDPSFSEDWAGAEDLMLAADAAGIEGASNPMDQLLQLTDAIRLNSDFRTTGAPITAGPSRNAVDRLHRDISAADSSDADPLISVYEMLEDSGVPSEKIYQHLAARLYHETDQNIDFSGEGSAAGFMSGDRLAADITSAANPMSGSGWPEGVQSWAAPEGLPPPHQPDSGLFLKLMGIR